MKTQKYNEQICQIILNHLQVKKDHQESLDGLILEIYNTEIKKLSQEIIKNLTYLMSNGYITETVDASGKKQYKLIMDNDAVSRFIDSVN